VSRTPPGASEMSVFAPGTASGQCAILPLGATLADGAEDAPGGGVAEATLAGAAGAGAELSAQLSQPARKARGMTSDRASRIETASEKATVTWMTWLAACSGVPECSSQ